MVNLTVCFFLTEQTQFSLYNVHTNSKHIKRADLDIYYDFKLKSVRFPWFIEKYFSALSTRGSDQVKSIGQ